MVASTARRFNFLLAHDTLVPQNAEVFDNVEFVGYGGICILAHPKTAIHFVAQHQDRKREQLGVGHRRSEGGLLSLTHRVLAEGELYGQAAIPDPQVDGADEQIYDGDP